VCVRVCVCLTCCPVGGCAGLKHSVHSGSQCVHRVCLCVCLCVFVSDLLTCGWLRWAQALSAFWLSMCSPRVCVCVCACVCDLLTCGWLRWAQALSTFWLSMCSPCVSVCVCDLLTCGWLRWAQALSTFWLSMCSRECVCVCVCVCVTCCPVGGCAGLKHSVHSGS